MKRLKLEDFKLKNLKETKASETSQLVGQTLGDCHDTEQTWYTCTYVLGNDWWTTLNC